MTNEEKRTIGAICRTIISAAHRIDDEVMQKPENPSAPRKGSDEPTVENLTMTKQEMLERANNHMAIAHGLIAEYQETDETRSITDKWHDEVAVEAEPVQQNYYVQRTAHEVWGQREFLTEREIAAKLQGVYDLGKSDGYHGGDQWPADVLHNRATAEPLSTRPLPDLIVTKDGVPFEDQAEGVRQFKEACLRGSTKIASEENIKATDDGIREYGSEKGHRDFAQAEAMQEMRPKAANHEEREARRSAFAYEAMRAPTAAENKYWNFQEHRKTSPFPPEAFERNTLRHSDKDLESARPSSECEHGIHYSDGCRACEHRNNLELIKANQGVRE